MEEGLSLTATETGALITTPIAKTMNAKKIEESVELPEGTQVQCEGSVLTVKGKKGEVARTFLCPTVKIAADGKKVVVTALNATKREKKMIGTFIAHIKGMVKGANEGHAYKMKICSGHFPMKAIVKGDTFIVENFLGEKIPRILPIRKGVAVTITGNDVLVLSADKELAGQCAASIERLTAIRGRDTRIFQDGIYITEKSGKEIE